MVRKFFIMSKTIADTLKELSLILNKDESQVLCELIDERMEQVLKQKKLDSLKTISGITSGHIDENIDIQSIKSQSKN